MQTTTVKKWEKVNTKAIIRCLTRVFETGDINQLNEPTYKFVMNLSGFMAHYDLFRFRDTYHDLRNLIAHLEASLDIQNPNRYFTDKFFQSKPESADYYKSKTATLRAIRPLMAQYKERIHRKFTALEQVHELYAERRANDQMKGLSGSEMAVALTEALQFLSRKLGEMVNNYPYETELFRQKSY